MRHFSTLALAATITAAGAINLVKREDGPPRVVQHDIQRRSLADTKALVQRDRNRMRRRTSNTVQESLTNEETLYFANVSIGTPAQSLRLHLDTGSSDLWVNVASSTLCKEKSDPCSASGTYASNDSTTYEYLNSEFNITYVDGTGSAGDYVTDTITFGGTTLDAQEFGIGYTSTSDEGIMGIGYAINEAILSVAGAKTYVNVPQHLMQSGYINTNAYSLWLNDLDASTGSILFGGVDTDKYTGTLETVPIVKEDGYYAEFIIALTAVGMDGTQGSLGSDLNTPALLDSGSSLMYLPNDVTQKIYDDLGASYDSSEGVAFIDCSFASNDSTIDLTFSSPTISVTMSELVIVAGEEDGVEVCILGISPADGTTPVLGDTFLRSAYVVYDLTENSISLAQTAFNVTTSNILEITNATSTDTGIPSASAVANAVTSVAVSGGDAAISAVTLTSSAAGAPATPAPRRDLASFGAAVAAAGAGIMFAI